jgi:hypothetical protein
MRWIHAGAGATSGRSGSLLPAIAHLPTYNSGAVDWLCNGRPQWRHRRQDRDLNKKCLWEMLAL